jgi:hypothetical protein
MRYPTAGFPSIADPVYYFYNFVKLGKLSKILTEQDTRRSSQGQGNKPSSDEKQSPNKKFTPLESAK